MDKTTFLKQLKQDIDKLTPYKNNYSMSDIVGIKDTYNELVMYEKSLNIFGYNVKRFFDKKKYSDFLLITGSNGLYNIILKQ